MDIVVDPLPDGELCIIRQVLQHLANDDISEVLREAHKYRLVVTTDTQFRGDEAPSNRDILPFHGTREVFSQGLRLERAPFNEKIELLLNHSAGDRHDLSDLYLRTILIRNR